MHIDEFIFSTHGELRLAERGIDRDDIQETVLHPIQKKQQYRGTHGGFVWKMNRKIDGKNLAVIAELYKQTCYIVSAFYEE
jgi:hypothetical protein